MATPGGVNPDDIKKNIELLGEMQSTLNSFTDIYEEINHALQQQDRVMKEVSKLTTSITNQISRLAELEAKIGKEYIKRRDIQKQIDELSAKEILAKTKAEALTNKMSVNERLTLNMLLYQRQQLATMEDDLKGMVQGSQQYRTQLTNILNLEQQIHTVLNTRTAADIRQVYLLNEQEESAKKIGALLTSQLPLLEQANLKVAKHKITQHGIDELLSLMPGRMGYFLRQIEKTSFRTEFLIASFGTLVILIAEMFKFASKMDKQITGIGNSLNVSKDSAKAVRDHFADVANSSTNVSKVLSDIYLTVENQVEAMHDLQDAFGTATVFTDKMVQGQIFLTKQLKLSKEEAAAIAQIGGINNITGEKAAMLMTRQVVLFEKEKGVRFEIKKVIQEVAKINGQLFAQYQGSPELLAKAVLQAQRLGINLEKAKQMGEYLLDFESSIESELQAEILTGKQLNLEKARSLALDGKSAEASAEMLKQVGTFAEYSKMNVIVQRSLAQAMGMNADEMTNALKKQELLTKAGFENEQALRDQYEIARKNGKLAEFEADVRSKMGDDTLLKQAAQLSAQERLNQALEKLGEIFGNIMAGPFYHILQGIASLLSNTTVLKGILIAVAGILTFAATQAIALAIATAAASASVVPIIGAALGIAAATAMGIALASASKEAGKTETLKDGVINPQGDIQISTPKGKIVPDKNDYVITTTNPQGLLKGSGGNISMNTKNLEEKLDQIIHLLEKGGHVYMDSKKVGTTQGLSYSAFA